MWKVKLFSRVCLCDSMDCVQSGSYIHGIFQARILEYVAISFSRGPSRPRDWTQVSTLQADSLQSEPPENPTTTTTTTTTATTTTKSLQLCLTLCDPTDSSPSGSTIPGILQARTLEWVAISSSNAWKWKVKVKSLSRVRLLATPWTAAYQAPPSMGFSRQEYWSGVPLPSPIYTLLYIK